MSQTLYRRYRPEKFKDISGQEHVVKTLQNQLKAGSVAHAYLFTGPRGIGKTTIARLVAKAINCEKVKESEPCGKCSSCTEITTGNALDVFEIDAASHTDVENVRENIIKNVRFAPNKLNRKVYIIDEVHMLSTSAFNALLKTLEEPPEHALFILATTEIHKVPETIISRCQRFDFARIDKAELVKRMKRILKKEGVVVADDVLAEIARHSGGFARDAESMLGQVLALGEKEISMDQAMLVLPATTAIIVEQFIDSMFSKGAGETIKLLNQNLEQGVDLKHFLDDVISKLRDQLLETVSEGKALVSVDQLRFAIEKFLKARRHINVDHLPQLPLELAIVEIVSEGARDQELAVGNSTSASLRGAEGDDVKSRGNHVALRKAVSVEKKIEKSDFKKQEVDLDIQETQPLSSRPSEASGEISHIRDLPASSNNSEALLETVQEETVFDSVPVISLEEVKEKWPTVFEQIQECNASLPLFMESCEICGVKDDHVELAFEYDLHVQAVNKEKNRVLIEKVLEKVLGKKVKVRALKTEKKESDSVKDLLEEFGGSVV